MRQRILGQRGGWGSERVGITSGLSGHGKAFGSHFEWGREPRRVSSMWNTGKWNAYQDRVAE